MYRNPLGRYHISCRHDHLSTFTCIITTFYPHCLHVCNVMSAKSMETITSIFFTQHIAKKMSEQFPTSLTHLDTPVKRIRLISNTHRPGRWVNRRGMFLFLLFNTTITFPCHATAVPDYIARLTGLRNVGIYGIEHYNKKSINDKLTKLHDRFKVVFK